MIKQLSLLEICFLSMNINAQTWTALTSGTTTNLLGTFAVNDSVAYASGYFGTILKTTNGGNSWTPQNSGTSHTLYSMHFTSIDTGYAVGDSGAAVITTNGGVTWSPMTVNANRNFRFIKFVNSQIGFISAGTVGGGNGYVYKTTNGGTSWTSVLTTPMAIYSTSFSSPTEGCASEYSGAIHKTTDGGTSWTSSPSGIGSSSGQLYFTSPANGVYVSNMLSNANGVIVQTTDSGATWGATVGSSTTSYLFGVDFYDTNNGYASGGDIPVDTATLLKTSNGGSTWNVVPLPSGTKRLTDISFYRNHIGYIVGKNGTILRLNLCQVTANISANINQVANGTVPSIVLKGNSGLLPYTFSYTINGGTIQTASTPLNSDSVVISVPTNIVTTYTYKLLQVTDANGCSKNLNDSVIIIVNSPLNVKTMENEKSVIGIYPNPCGDQLKIFVNKKSSVTISDVTQKHIYSGKLEIGENILNTEHFERGLYFITITNSEGMFTKKIVKN